MDFGSQNSKTKGNHKTCYDRAGKLEK
jgi:hypothetical protein